MPIGFEIVLSIRYAGGREASDSISSIPAEKSSVMR